MIEFTSKPTLKELSERTKEAKNRISKLETPLAKCSIYLDRWVQTNFKTQGGNVGGWQPLKGGGRWIKGKGIDTSAKILQDTGRLRASFTPFHTRKNAGIYSDIDYAKKHEEGEGVPVRRMLPKHIEVRNDIRKIFRGHIVDALRLK